MCGVKGAPRTRPTPRASALSVAMARSNPLSAMRWIYGSRALFTACEAVRATALGMFGTALTRHRTHYNIAERCR